MSISNFLRNMFWAVLLGGCVLSHQGEAADTRKCAAPQPTVDSTYSPGQVWSYKSRPSEGSSTVTILRVETSPKVGVIVHVRIDGVQFKNCKGGPAPTTIDHAPFTKIAMDKSVSRQLRTVSELPEFEAGYKDWLAHCGGVYTVSVAKMVDVDDATFNAGLGCKT
jgi:hypothetical protein